MPLLAPISKWAAQIGGSSGDRGRRCAISVSSLTRLGLDEHFRERRMRGIGAMRRERQFHITGEFQLALAERPIGDGQPAQFDVVFGGDGDIHASDSMPSTVR